MAELIALHSKYVGKCKVCGGGIAKGSKILWHPEMHFVLHYECGSADTTVPLEQNPAPVTTLPVDYYTNPKYNHHRTVYVGYARKAGAVVYDPASRQMLTLLGDAGAGTYADCRLSTPEEGRLIKMVLDKGLAEKRVSEILAARK